MKTNHPSYRLLLAGALVAAAASFTALRAGPGIESWNKQGQVNNARSDSVPATAPKACTDPMIVGVFATRNELPNGKGLTRNDQVGTKQVCTSCATPSTVLVPGLPNGKGPLVARTLVSTHDCVSCVIR